MPVSDTGWIRQPRGTRTGTLPSCLLNGNQMRDLQTQLTSILLHNQVLKPVELCTLATYPFRGLISHCRFHSPPPKSLAFWQPWRHCRWINRFQLRSHSGCLIWGKSRCAPQIPHKQTQPFFVNEHHLLWRTSEKDFFLSRELVCDFRHQILVTPAYFSNREKSKTCGFMIAFTLPKTEALLSLNFINQSHH